PARRLADDRAINLVAPGQEPRATRFRRQRASVEKLLLHVIGHAQAELGVARQPCEEVLRIAPGQGARGALDSRVARRKWSGAIHIQLFDQQRVLGVVSKETKTA